MPTKIEWAQETWNPIVGCTPVSSGCKKCYAQTMASRLAAMATADARAGRNAGRKASYLPVVKNGKWNGRVSLVREALKIPLGWREPRDVFVDSMGDLFHESAPFDFIDEVFDIMRRCPQHTFKILTKRPHVAFRYTVRAEPLPNVVLGTSCEDQETANLRIPWLLQCRAVRRFLSLEPLLGPIRLPGFGAREAWCSVCLRIVTDSIAIQHAHGGGASSSSYCFSAYDMIHQVIVGGESGGGARQCEMEWIEGIAQQCYECSVPLFVKQTGSKPRHRGRDLSVSGKGDRIEELPKALRVRQGISEARS